MQTPAEIAIECSQCHKQRKGTGKRLPAGWKRWRGDLHCGDCWAGLFLLRAISVPIAKPLDGDWKTLRDTLRVMWRETTQVCNWIMTELYARDVRRQPGEEKLPPMRPQYFYPEIRGRWPELPPQTPGTLAGLSARGRP